VTGGPAIPVAGRVLDANGDPVRGAAVMFGDAPGPVQDVAELTGADGTFTLTAPLPGRYRIQARGPGGASAELDVDVGAVPPPGEVRIVLRG
jgi:protocatechuate 3,4-dioxygenase beta subunit